MNNRPAGLHPPPQTGITPNNAAPNSVVPNQRRSKQRCPELVSLRAHPHSLKTLAVRPCLHSFKQRSPKPAPHSASLAPRVRLHNLNTFTGRAPASTPLVRLFSAGTSHTRRFIPLRHIVFFRQRPYLFRF